MVSCEYRDFPEPIQIPSSIPIFGRDLLDPGQDCKNDAYKWLLHHSRRYTLAKGMIVNSFKDLEPGPIKALQEKEPPVYPAEEAVVVYHGEHYRNKRWTFPAHNFTFSIVWSPFLAKATIFEDDNGMPSDIIQLHLDELDTVWTQQYRHFDYIFIAGGNGF
ncbi:hypothetical protein ACH5RR_000092 [Cinchona calisaya]|uniref:Trichome birefringence-like C-terminal domain-containing protein n=1 Tax=Cinchona calisaya TaxID=153742 RepID=A0ABD3AZW3_9GENT